MSDENKYSNEDKDSRKNGDFRVPPKTWIVWIVIFGGILTLFLFQKRFTEPSESILPKDFLAKVDAGLIDSATLNFSPQSPIYDITGKYKEVGPNGEPKA